MAKADVSLEHRHAESAQQAAGARRPHAWRDLAAVVGLAAALLVVGPFVFGSYLLNVLIQAFFFSIVVVTVDLLWGYTGYLTFGQSAFFGLGAYAAGLMFTHGGFSALNAVLAIAAAIAATAVVAVILGWLSFYRGASPFFATVMSLVLPIVLTQVLLSGGAWTGSSSGLTGFETFDLSLGAWYWISGAALLLVAMCAWFFVRSDGGRLLAAIRDNEARCSYLGINTSFAKIALLIATAVIAGLAGFGYGSFSGVVAPELSGFLLGTQLVIWVALGGRGTLWGPVIGSLLINVATAYLSGSMPFAWQLILGAAFVLVIVLLPQGLVPLLVKPLRRFMASAPAQPVLTERALRAQDPTAAGELALQMRAVERHFGSLKVLQGIDLEAAGGELVGLIGPNGAGKTTLMRCMSDGAERSSGSVALGGADIGQLPPEQCVRLGLGRKFQNANVFETLTVAECLRIAGTIVERPSFVRSARTLALPPYALEVVRATRLDRKLGAVAKDLSHGEQQALELAMVLALEPRIVLLDEPTAGLTKVERTQIGNVLSALAHRYGLCCLLVEHDLDFVAEVATRIVVLHQGKIVMQGSFAEVVASELVKTIYSGSAHGSAAALSQEAP
ncbi:branched-chain amino acid ABC transporter ATP-binding protein/permease [Trinickia caryophylli]|uniref:Amino acid/amide ABC transporter membrane protein 2, HAAT family /amino acid/amide ABC transporter ATP-binding protein 1, HAAT family n=1 Tax=Trinickia caryophylli TaxID=28094 RepID=A0A1X7EDS9_TRICW|nr:branched-chain amino acid ABC transporter ATP-binding protein/permease [Trinickia caryophylli]PMS12867.1 branched-chain amino acid ABC transporter substrate-binding protein [Trinickia caryophylli]TRX14618.1 branched-chain amino acid ABC transporter ATP-binding protein/permease [Trinickia caryophylli]WQE14461.1 branched-chain amino acid ABC transporter ATP-binding protein/permease [Trinickia caryophylli]SMF32201.1 amino acid/amide ABC transporter membrane protein 2, HAAT family /amino acid/am